MEFNIIPDEEAMSKCAWCHNHISDDMEVFGVCAKLKPDVDLSEYESHCIQIGLVSEEKPIYMIVTTDQRTSQNHRLQPSQSDQRAHLCVLCCFKKHTNPFRAFKKKIGGGIDHQIASLMVNLSNFILRTLFQGRRMVALFF